MAKTRQTVEDALSVWEAVLQRCCGLDVHKKVVVACLLVGDLDRHPRKFIRSFETTTKGLTELRDWLKENGCTHVAAESTGVYWKPVYNVLADSVKFLLINAYHMKQIPGKKTDVKDAEWIARLLRWGLLKPSLIPPQEIRELRDLCRYRKRLTEQASAEKNRVQKELEDANIKLASVATDIFGVSGRNILQALVTDHLEPEEMAEMAQGKLRRKIPELVDALAGKVREHHRLLIRMHLDHLCYLEEVIAQLNEQITQKLAPYRRQIELICSTPGYDVISAQHVFVEIGGDISVFPSEAHLASWTGLCPGNNESAGKRKSGRTRKGNRWLKSVAIQCAHAAGRSKGTYLSAFYHRVAARRGSNRAAVAVAHKQICSVYQELSHDKPYQELGEHFFDSLDPRALQRRLVKRLESLGWKVKLEPQAVA